MTIEDIVTASILEHKAGNAARTFWTGLSEVSEEDAASIGRRVEWKWLHSNLNGTDMVREHESLDGVRLALKAFERAEMFALPA